MRRRLEGGGMILSRRAFSGWSLVVAAGSVVFRRIRQTSTASDSEMNTSHTADAAAQDGIQVPAHFVPTPRTISPQAQAFLAHSPPIESVSLPAKDDKAGWRAFLDASNRGMLALTAKYAERYPADVVTHKLSAASLYEVTPRNV